jgi:hypothetical protein
VILGLPGDGERGERGVPVAAGYDLGREDEVRAVDAGFSLPLNQPIDDLSIFYLDGKYNGNFKRGS